jgi:predicted dehydrogenase
MILNHHDPILVMGAGSIGERHIGILRKLGYSNIWVYRQRNIPLRIVDKNSIHVFTDLSLTDQIKPKAAIICTPTFQHLAQALFCAERGISVLIEKPLSHDLAGFDQLKTTVQKNNVYVQTAYMLRFHTFFQSIKSISENKELGNLLSMQTYWGEYLPDWHPWEDYRQSYAARKEMGGGAALTLSHDIDLVNWISESTIKNWSTIKNYNSALEVNVESGADISIAYQNGITAHCHVNFHERIPKRWYRFVFEYGSVEVDYLKSVMTIFKPKEIITQNIPDFDRNQLYESQLLYFLRQINEGNFSEAAINSINESEAIIKICR